MPPLKSPKPEAAPHQPGDAQRAIARQALLQTELLEKSIKKGDVSSVRSALENGALPEHAVFRDKKGRTTSSALAMSMDHPDLDITKLLMDFGAPIALSSVGNVWRAALEKDRTERFALLLSKVKPRAQEWEFALTRSLKTFMALDDLLPLDRCKNVGRLKKTGAPPLFFVIDPKLLDYLIDTGADVHQVPLPTPVDLAGPGSWYNRTAINHMICRSFAWSLHGERYKEQLPDLVKVLNEAGAPLSEDDFLQACRAGNKELLFFFIDRGFRLRPEESEGGAPDEAFESLLSSNREVAEDALRYQKVLDEAGILEYKTTQTDTGSSSRRL
jgi:hypothetical protein